MCRLALMLIGLLIATIADAEAACFVRDILIKQADVRRGSSSNFRVVGEMINNCVEPVGVHLQFTFRDASGKVASVESGWPASISNIPPGGSFPFDLAYRMKEPFTTMEARVIEVRRW